jgi:hypothetical protein
MADLLLKFVSTSWTRVTRWADPSPALQSSRSEEHRIGRYRADYSRLTPEEIAQEDKELTELYDNSRPVSR